MSEPENFIVENIREWTGRCEERYSRVALQREGKDPAQILPIVVTKSSRHFLPSFLTEGAALKKIAREEMRTESWNSVFFGEGKKPEVVIML